MAIAVSHPGVYIQEVSSGARTIVGVATSIAAFAGRALRGPTDRPVRVQSFAEYTREFGGLWHASTMSHAVQQFFANGGGDAVIVRVHNGAAAASLALVGFTLAAANEGDWGEQLRVRVDHDTRPLQPGEAANSLFNLAVRDMVTGAVERYTNVSTEPTHARYVARVLAQQSKLVRVSGAVAAARPPANAVLPAGADPFLPAYSTAFGANGSDGNPIGTTEVVGVPAPLRPNALQMLDEVDLFNLLCLPPPTRETDWTSAVWNPAATYCAQRRAVLLVDPPATWDEAADVIAGIGALVARTNAAALYFPRVLAPDPLKEFAPMDFAPCGVVAGVIARTDATRGVWKAPAGLEARMNGVSALSLGGVPGLLTDGQVGQLNPIGVNCLRTVAGTGHVVWGARTLDGADFLGSEWKYLPVRRTAYFIEESLFRATQWAVFEPNDEALWAQLRLNIGAFMHDLFRQGAFQGTKPGDAYFVKCSRETTTQADIDRGIVNVLVGFAPLKPAEFVVITIQQIVQQQN